MCPGIFVCTDVLGIVVKQRAFSGPHEQTDLNTKIKPCRSNERIISFSGTGSDQKGNESCFSFPPCCQADLLVSCGPAGQTDGT